jgi:hypothetical protein
MDVPPEMGARTRTRAYPYMAGWAEKVRPRAPPDFPKERYPPNHPLKLGLRMIAAALALI